MVSQWKFERERQSDREYKTSSGFWVALVGRQSLDFAFTNYRIWEALGIACGYLMARTLTVNVYLLISVGFLMVGMVGYTVLENYDPVMVRI